MKKSFLSFLVIFASAGYVLYQYTGASSATANSPVAIVATQPPSQTTQLPVATDVPATSPPPVNQNPTPTPAPAPMPVVVPAPSPAPKPKGQYADGTYTGTPADAYYGTVQVQAVIQNGKITDVTFLQYPNDRRTSQYINGNAMPILISEAIQAQSANVNGVSGASETSPAFRVSLADALSQAKI